MVWEGSTTTHTEFIATSSMKILMLFVEWPSLYTNPGFSNLALQRSNQSFEKLNNFHLIFCVLSGRNSHGIHVSKCFYIRGHWLTSLQKNICYNCSISTHNRDECPNPCPTAGHRHKTHRCICSYNRWIQIFQSFVERKSKTNRHVH